MLDSFCKIASTHTYTYMCVREYERMRENRHKFYSNFMQQIARYRSFDNTKINNSHNNFVLDKFFFQLLENSDILKNRKCYFINSSQFILETKPKAKQQQTRRGKTHLLINTHSNTHARNRTCLPPRTNSPT